MFCSSKIQSPSSKIFQGKITRGSSLPSLPPLVSSVREQARQDMQTQKPASNFNQKQEYTLKPSSPVPNRPAPSTRPCLPLPNLPSLDPSGTRSTVQNLINLDIACNIFESSEHAQAVSPPQKKPIPPPNTIWS
ncbi:uncharacterized protein N7500_004374 [Penicillium coprophilum]|uniref:uncharacterized protein n=1 Tax=Penicillium coprophilum TaxID=36646 RepID=UPI00238F9E3A|nr:uncharacterized protein N7500_004374 [Penicillium coprophilum]KAJ5171591.1 hypothetical protein N7500_004374 [Penicillium coprophilum]